MKEEKGANDLLSLLPPYHIRHLHLATKGFQLCKAEAQHMGCSVLYVIWPGRERGGSEDMLKIDWELHSIADWVDEPLKKQI